jgi:hypothetical protein
MANILNQDSLAMRPHNLSLFNVEVAMIDSFTRHPRSVGETYGEHFSTAAGFGASMVLAGLACLVHAALPFVFERTGSRCIERLHERMSTRARRPGP